MAGGDMALLYHNALLEKIRAKAIRSISRPVWGGGG